MLVIHLTPIMVKDEDIQAPVVNNIDKYYTTQVWRQKKRPFVYLCLSFLVQKNFNL